MVAVKVAVVVAANAEHEVDLTCARFRQGGGKHHPPSGSREAAAASLAFFLTRLTEPTTITFVAVACDQASCCEAMSVGRALKMHAKA